MVGGVDAQEVCCSAHLVGEMLRIFIIVLIISEQTRSLIWARGSAKP